MNQPLGTAVGNAIELRETIDILHGNGLIDFLEQCLVIAINIIFFGEKKQSIETARELSQKVIDDGSAWSKFEELVEAQGGDITYINQPEKLPRAPVVHEIKVEKQGYLSMVNAQVVGETSVDLGAGRQKKSDSIDHSVGILVHGKVGDHLKKGDLLFTILAKSESDAKAGASRLQTALDWSDSPVEQLPLFYDVIK